MILTKVLKISNKFQSKPSGDRMPNNILFWLMNRALIVCWINQCKFNLLIRTVRKIEIKPEFYIHKKPILGKINGVIGDVTFRL